MCLLVRRRKMESRNQLDATQCFIELVVCSTCFGHVYALHQELATILLVVWYVVCNSWLLVVGRSGAGRQAMRLSWGMLFDSIPQPGRIACGPAPDAVRQLPSTRTHSMWPCARPSNHKFIKHCVASSWFLLSIFHINVSLRIKYLLCAVYRSGIC